MSELNYSSRFGYSNRYIDRLRILNESLSLFGQARMHAFISEVRSLFKHSNMSLQNLNTVDADEIQNRYYAGLKTIEMEKITGTLGRVSDFDRDFNPLTDRVRDRWVSVALARTLNISLDPVKLIKFGDSYFVADGHHRISVAHARGERNIDAEIYVWETSIQHSWK